MTPLVTSPPKNTSDTEVPAREVTRRSFLRYLGLGTASLFVVADGALAYRVYDQGVLVPGRGPAFEALENWQSFTGPEALVAAAVLAASAHNTQPWAFAVTPGHVDLYGDPTRTTGANDPLMREFYASLGCALENAVLAARAQGYEPEVALATAPSQNDFVARINLSPGESTTNELYDAIGSRRSNRSEYTGAAVAPEILDEMKRTVDESVAPADLIWLTDGSQRAKFADLLVAATKAHNEDEDQSRDSFAWWRGSWDEVQERKDGLNIDGVGLPPLVRSIGKILPNTSRQSSDETFLERTRLQADSAAAFGVVTVSDPHSLRDQLAGGRLLQRLHLWAAAHDVGFQHMNQITERIDRDRQLGNPNSFAEPLGHLVGGRAVLGAFRIGTPTVAALASPRRNTSEVLI